MISIDSEIFCQNCTNEFNDNNLPRMLTMCGHTYCENCIRNMINQENQQNQQIETQNISIKYFVQCPDDGTKMSLSSKDIKVFPKNLALIKVLQSKKNNSSFKDQFFNLSKIAKQEQIAEDLSSDQLINVMNEAKQSLSKSEGKISQEDQQIIIQQQRQNHNQNQQEQQSKSQKKDLVENYLIKQELQELCLLHQKPLQIICLNDQQKICSKCAIFGQHKGHDFKSIEQVEQETNSCYMKILKLFQQKQEIEKRMSNSDTQTALIDILIKKRDILQKQVKQEFRKLRQEITKQQKKVLRKLQQTYKDTEIKIKALLQIDQSIKTKFNKFQANSFQIIKILQSKQLQPKINFLYNKNKNLNKDKNNLQMQIIKNGQQIVNDLKSQQNTLIVKVQQLLSTLECKKSKRIYECVNDFVEIVSQSKRIQVIKKVEITEKSEITEKFVSSNNLIIKNQLKEECCKIKFSLPSSNPPNMQIQGSPLLEQSLLDIDQDSQKQHSTFQSVQVEIFNPSMIESYKPLSLNQNIINKDNINNNNNDKSISNNFINLGIDSVRKFPPSQVELSTQKRKNNQLEESFVSNYTTHRTSILTTKRSSLIPSKFQSEQRPNKKKLKTIKVSEKYEKILQGIYNNTLEVIDLTNGELGDQIMFQICEFIKHSKARTIKFIRNKLTDNGIERMIPMLGNAQILNLSQNNLTENVLDIIIANRYGHLSGLKNLVLSQNKIIERKHKTKIDQLRAMNMTVSV